MWLGASHMFSRFIIGLPLTAVFAFATVSAQSPATTGAIRCESCALTRQKPEPFDPAKNDVVPRVEPVFFSEALTGGARSEATLRMLFIARVLGTSPLRLEMLDSRAQHVDRKMAVVIDDVHGGRDPGTCGVDVWRTMGTMAVAADVKPLLPTLRFNDLVTGAWMLQRDRQKPESPLDGRPVVSELRKVTAPATWFHPVPATPNCQNRSGRLIVYDEPSGGLLTVYNDGGIQYSTQHGQVFAREGLSADELKELLAAFGEASIDTAPAFPDAATRMSGSRLLLAAARYQLVAHRLAAAGTRSGDRAPEPSESARDVKRSTGSANWRRTRDSTRRGGRRPGRSRPRFARARRGPCGASYGPTGRSARSRWTSTRCRSLRLSPVHEYLWPRDLGVRLADVPADGLIVPWSEVEQHKLVYYGLLNAGFKGRDPHRRGASLRGRSASARWTRTGPIAALRSSVARAVSVKARSSTVAPSAAINITFEPNLVEVRRRALTDDSISILRSARRSSTVPEKTRVLVVSQIFASWNRIGEWLRRLEALRGVA